MRYKLRLESAVSLSDSVQSLLFELVGPGSLDYVPGQYLDLLVPTPSGLVLKRPYSIASAPGRAGPNRVEVAVTRVDSGPTSMALHTLEQGTVVEAEGPRGGFIWAPQEHDSPALFIATGTGLAPIRAMLQQELDTIVGARVALLFGCPSQREILWRSELVAWAARIPRFELAVTLSRADPTWNGRTGYVQEHVAELVAALRPTHVYVCGLSPMIEAVTERLLQTGVESRSIRTENYGV